MGKLVFVCGAKGGVGTSTIATALYRLAPAPGPVLVDLTGSNLLSVYVNETDPLSQPRPRAATDLDSVFRQPRGAQELLRRARDGADLLLATRRRAPIGTDLARLLGQLTPLRDVVVDVGRELPQHGAPDHLVLVVIPDLRAVQRSLTMLHQLDAAGLTGRVLIVENFTAPGVQVFGDQLTLPRWVVPALNLGTPALVGRLRRLLADLGGQLYPAPSSDPAGPAPAPPPAEKRRGLIRTALQRG
ncbi:MAG: hypothetical protein KKA73_13905 [Chloroflexi bacterium]|nr:hypothetical protein [Chloroflexota bacterium]MBU1748778.1 hypothetical protein [Chloroflexota bacterium]